MIPAVIYAAKSTEDRHGSIQTQLEQCRALCEQKGWEVVVEYQDEGFSAYSGNRGPGLVDAREHAGRVAASTNFQRHQGREVVMLVAQHSDRFSRGAGDAPGAAQALVEIWHQERRRNVHLRSVQDDADLRDSASVASIGKRNADDSRRKSLATKDGKARQIERGEWLGGVVLDGYRRVPYIEDGAVKSRYELDPDRAPLIRRIFAMRAEGHTTSSIAQTLNREGHRTLRGIEWQARRIRETLRTPFYAGRLYGVEGKNWPALISPEAFDQLQELPKNKAGRPPVIHGTLALAKLARCNRCGRAMHSITSPTPRKDGTRRRSYWCAQARFGACDAPRIESGRVDTAIVEHLEQMFIDVEAWQAELMHGASEQQSLIEQELAGARAVLTKLQRQEELLRQVWIEALDGGDARADAREEAFISVRDKRVEAEGSIRPIEERLAQVPTEPPTDEILDVHSELARIVRGGQPGDLRDLNERLRLIFSHVEMDTMEDGTVAVLPILRDDVVERFADPSGALQVITAQGTSLMAPTEDLPPSAGLLLVTGDEKSRHGPPAKPFHINKIRPTTSA